MTVIPRSRKQRHPQRPANAKSFFKEKRRFDRNTQNNNLLLVWPGPQISLIFQLKTKIIRHAVVIVIIIIIIPSHPALE